MSDPNTQWRYSIQDTGAQAAEVSAILTSADDAAPIGVADTVVQALLERGSVTSEQVALAVSHSGQGRELWRTLLRVAGVDRDAVFAEAARHAGIATGEVNAWEPPDELVQSILGLFGPETVQLLLRAGMFPIEVLADEAVDEFTLAFVSNDPTSQAASQIAASLGVKTRFFFAPESVILARVSGLGHGLPDPVQDIVSPLPSNDDDFDVSDAEVAVESAVDEEDEIVSSGYESESDLEIPAFVDEAEDPPVEEIEIEENLEDETVEPSSEFSGEADHPDEPVNDFNRPVDDKLSSADIAEPGIDAAAPDTDDAAQFSSPYVELLEAQDGQEVLVEDIFADISSAIQILDEEDDATSDLRGSDDPVHTGEQPIDDAGQDQSSVPAADNDIEPSAGKVDEQNASEGSHVEPVSEPAGNQNAPRDRVVVMLLHKHAVTKDLVAEAVRIQREEQPKEALWRLLAQVPGVDRDAVYAEAASVYAFPMADISDPDPNFARLVMETFSEERRELLLSMGLLPLEYEMDTASGSAKLVFATHDPARPDVHRVLQQLKLGRFELKYAPESEIKRITNDIFPRRNEYLDRMTDDPMAVDLGTAFEQDKGELIDEEALEAEISRSTLINLFEATLVEATRSGASDIHIFPNPQRKVEIHFRTDGRLQRWHVEDKVHPEAFLAVVKDNSVNVDRFERDAAQDGFIQRRIDDALIRFRVSVLPIATASQEIRAESIVIRVLDDRKVLTDLRKLGMLDVALERFDRAIRQPHGMVILTGPTGSGKSTTLVAALHQVVTPAVNVLTVEDPVEYIIKGVRQIKLSHKLNLEQALRSILRHDPDVVMVGEMRDQQTAELAIKLANTGHLTFSTLHTNDAPSAVSRLYKMGIEPFLIAYAINLVVAQRLIRTLCPECKKAEEDPDHVLMRSLGFTDADFASTTFYVPGEKRTCRTCKGSGYKGRRAMCETLYFSRDIRHLVVESGEAIDEDAIREKARSEGMLTLQDSAREIVKMGETSVDELVRVTASE